MVEVVQLAGALMLSLYLMACETKSYIHSDLSFHVWPPASVHASLDISSCSLDVQYKEIYVLPS